MRRATTPRHTGRIGSRRGGGEWGSPLIGVGRPVFNSLQLFDDGVDGTQLFLKVTVIGRVLPLPGERWSKRHGQTVRPGDRFVELTTRRERRTVFACKGGSIISSRVRTQGGGRMTPPGQPSRDDRHGIVRAVA